MRVLSISIHSLSLHWQMAGWVATHKFTQLWRSRAIWCSCPDSQKPNAWHSSSQESLSLSNFHLHTFTQEQSDAPAKIPKSWMHSIRLPKNHFHFQIHFHFLWRSRAIWCCCRDSQKPNAQHSSSQESLSLSNSLSLSLKVKSNLMLLPRFPKAECMAFVFPRITFMLKGEK